MQTIIAILLLLVIPLLMILFNLTRWKYTSNWLIAVIGMFIVWPIVFFSFQDIPQTISYINWEPKSLFPISPSLLLDEISWTFSMALVTLGVTLVLTAVTRIDQPEPPSKSTSWAGLAMFSTNNSSTNWQTWAGSSFILGLGLVAVQSGNLLTIILAWAAIDIVELMILLTQVGDSSGRERAVLAFSARAAGIGIMILAEIQIWRSGGILSLSSISPSTSIYLLIAAGLRLGVLPLHLPFQQEIPLRRSLGTILRLVSAAASMSLLVRAASVGLVMPTANFLLILSTIAAVFGAVIWALAPDELFGRPYWILGTAALATAAAVSGQLNACLAWSNAAIFSGGLLFFTSSRRKWMIILIIAGFIGMSGLPFTPNWASIQFYSVRHSETNWVSALLFFCYVISHAFLLVGYLRHSLRRKLLAGDNPVDPQVERWIWFVYPLGLAMLPLTHFLTGYTVKLSSPPPQLATYITSIAISIIGIGVLFISNQPRFPQNRLSNFVIPTIPSILLSSSGLYRPLWFLYNQLQRISNLVQTLLEGDGGILWAIVLFFFILVFLYR